jgi:hypothetical protein
MSFQVVATIIGLEPANYDGQSVAGPFAGEPFSAP